VHIRTPSQPESEGVRTDRIAATDRENYYATAAGQASSAKVTDVEQFITTSRRR